MAGQTEITKASSTAYLFIHSQVTHFLNNEAKGTKIIGATSLADMVSKLKTPRKVMLLVKGKLYVVTSFGVGRQFVKYHCGTKLIDSELIAFSI